MFVVLECISIETNVYSGLRSVYFGGNDGKK